MSRRSKRICTQQGEGAFQKLPEAVQTLIASGLTIPDVLALRRVARGFRKVKVNVPEMYIPKNLTAASFSALLDVHITRSVKTLSLAGSFGVTADFIALLHRLPELQDLSMDCCGMGEVFTLPDMPKLRSLDVSSTRVDLDGLCKYKQLTKLSARFTEMDDRQLAAIASNLSDLRHLDLRSCYNVSSIESLSHTQLETLILQDTVLDDEKLGCLSNLVNLKSIDLSETGVTGSFIEKLKNPRLVSMELSFCYKLEEVHLASLPATLTYLDLNESGPFHVHVFQRLLELKHLTDLFLAGSYLTQNYLRNLSALALCQLDMSHSEFIRDDGLALLAAFAATLKMLNISGCYNVTNKGVKHLGVLSKLDALYMCELDKIDKHCLLYLVTLTNLNYFSFEETQLTQRQVERLAGLIPNRKFEVTDRCMEAKN